MGSSSWRWASLAPFPAMMGLVHSFMHMRTLVPQANQALAESIHALQAAFADNKR